MRYVIAVVFLLSGVTSGLAQQHHSFFDRHARVMFNVSLPPNCQSGWFGRGIGLVAICHLGWRSNVRFIDGFILPCMYPDCREHAQRIDVFLRQNGF